jgi:hypothetical protein
MRSTKVMGAIAALMLTAAMARAGASPQIGDTHEIILTTQSEQQGSNGSGSSNDRDTIVEKVIGVRADGVELEYDLPKGVSADEKATDWQFPFRVFMPSSGGQVQLLNSPELEARRDVWLKAAGLTRAACGHWVFTWNAFRIECDPQSVLDTVKAFDLRESDPREGGAYRDPAALSPGTWTKKTVGPDGAMFIAEMPVDPDAVRRARAQADVVTGEIMRQPVTLDAALQRRAKEAVSGTISVALETDTAGAGRRRTKVTKLTVKMPDGSSQTQTVTETLERRAISGHD